MPVLGIIFSIYVRSVRGCLEGDVDSDNDDCDVGSDEMRCLSVRQTALLQQLSPEDKVELLRVIKYIESTLQEHWQEYGDFQELQERILRLRMIIEEAPEGRESSKWWEEAMKEIKRSGVCVGLCSLVYRKGMYLIKKVYVCVEISERVDE